ncbi:thiamine phosphate synthase [Gracilimonas mengyeensis]|nr:thiamine phosphate synthase [Gracilimonas mengyeensis]
MSSTQQKTITGGVYLVLNPAMDTSELLHKLKQALDGSVDVLQIWNNWPDDITPKEKQKMVQQLLEVAKPYDVPVLINDEWELLAETQLDGVHFDKIPDNLKEIRQKLDRDFLIGITCGNDLQVIRRGEALGADYFSFCAMFPSSSVDDCEIVRPDTVQKAREITEKPLFVSGGITPENLPKLENLDIEGVAVISGILSADDPRQASLDYHQALKNLN